MYPKVPVCWEQKSKVLMLHQKIAHIPHTIIPPGFGWSRHSFTLPPYNAGTIEGNCYLLLYKWVTKVEVEVSTFLTSFWEAGFGLGRRLCEWPGLTGDNFAGWGLYVGMAGSSSSFLDLPLLSYQPNPPPWCWCRTTADGLLLLGDHWIRLVWSRNC